MANQWGGKSYDNDWFEVDGMGNRVSGEKDWAANAAWASENQTQNPYTNQPGSSPYDKSGTTPGNEPGSTLPPVAGGGGPVPPAPDPLTQNVQGAINDALTQGPVVNESDPTFQAQDQANKIQSQRAAERARMSAAQRMHAQGQGDSGALDSEVARLEQQRGETDQRLNAELRSSYLNAERQRYAQALQLGAGLMTAQEERALRQKLADIQAQLAREDLNFRRDFSYDQLGQNLGLSLADLQYRSMQNLF